MQSAEVSSEHVGACRGKRGLSGPVNPGTCRDHGFVDMQLQVPAKVRGVKWALEFMFLLRTG